MKTTLLRQIFPERLAKILLGTAMNSILSYSKRADREVSENIDFYLSLVYRFEQSLFVLRCRDRSKSPPHLKNIFLKT